MKEKKMYCTPAIEVLKATIEKGYQVSGPDVPPQPEPDPSDQFNAGGYTGWTEGGNTNEWFS